MLCNQMSAGAAVFEIVELQVTAGDRVGFETALLRCGSKAELARHPAPQRRLTICLPRSTAPGILPTSTAPSWLALNAPPRALRAASLPLCLMKSPLTGKRLVGLPFSDLCPLLAEDEASATDLINQAISLAEYLGQPPELTTEVLEAACASYFVDDREAEPTYA